MEPGEVVTEVGHSTLLEAFNLVRTLKI